MAREMKKTYSYCHPVYFSLLQSKKLEKKDIYLKYKIVPFYAIANLKRNYVPVLSYSSFSRTSFTCRPILIPVTKQQKLLFPEIEYNTPSTA